jgi:hypothetical protein
MKKNIFLLLGFFCMISCVPPAEKISGNYNGQYTYNTSISNGVTAAVVKETDNTVTINFSGGGISPLTISGISITSNNQSFALTKTGFAESVSGAVDNNQLSVSYGFMSGAMTYVGTK